MNSGPRTRRSPPTTSGAVTPIDTLNLPTRRGLLVARLTLSSDQQNNWSDQVSGQARSRERLMADRISQVLHATSTIRCRRTTARLTAVFGLCVALAPHPSAGEQGNGSPAFEVASIKPTTAESPLGRGVFTFPGGRVVANGCTLEKLIEEAFRVDPYQVSGGPRWIRDDRYDVEAKPPESSGVSKLNPASAKTPLLFLLAKGTSEHKG